MINTNLMCWVLILTMIPLLSIAQKQVPQPSPKQTITQVVGLTNFTVEYSRPSVKGRHIFGGLVPYNKVWRTGANENTTIEFDTSVKVGGKKVEAGKYALYTKPGEKSWQVYLYKDANNWGVPKSWDESKIVAKADVEIYPMPVSISSFTITFDDLTSGSVAIGLLWDKVYAGLKIEVPTKELVYKNIEKLEDGPSPWELLDYAYYFSDIKEYDKAKMWIDKAVTKADKKEGFKNKWYIQYRQAKVYKDANLNKQAKEIAKKALKVVKELAKTDDSRKEMVETIQKLIDDIKK